MRDINHSEFNQGEEVFWQDDIKKYETREQTNKRLKQKKSRVRRQNTRGSQLRSLRAKK